MLYATANFVAPSGNHEMLTGVRLMLFGSLLGEKKNKQEKIRKKRILKKKQKKSKESEIAYVHVL